MLLESTVANIALPALGSSLDASMSELQWTVNAFTLTLSALILLGGGLGDRFCRRRTYLVGVVRLGVASLLCGAAPIASAASADTWSLPVGLVVGSGDDG